MAQGHYSASLAHLANTSYRLGQRLSAGEIAERLKGNDEALATLEDFRANLDANRIDMGKELAVTGPTLAFDPVMEQFTGEFAAEANKLQEDDYREEFKLPEIG
jgi:hypothetical protein